MILADHEITRLVVHHQMIEPFEEKQVRELPSGERVISYGLSSYGYDMRVADEFKVFTPNPYNTVIDPKEVDTRAFVDFQGEVCIIPPNSYVLCRSVEYFRMPGDVIGITLGKSTYARSGLIVNCTPAEPGWEGHLTIEISNASPLPAKVYANEGVAQMLFFRGMMPDITYKSKAGKYQGQTGVTLARL